MISRLGALALALVALTVACGPPPERKNEITLGVALEPPNLDPTAGAAAAIDEVVYANVFEGLTRIGPDGTVEPALARQWTISPDGLTYDFALATGVRFHDGTPFEADDVKFSLDRARAPSSTNAQKELFAAIDSVEVTGPAAVRVHLTRPDGAFLFNMAWGDAVIVAAETAATNAVKPIGTGPFRFSRWLKGSRIELLRNPDYWGAPAKLEKATFVFIADPSAAFAALMAGDVDGFPDFPAPELLAQLRKDGRFAVTTGTTEGETILALNNRRAPFSDARVRRALAYAVNRRAIIDGAMFGYGTPIGSHFAPHNPAYVDLTGLRPYAPARAKTLLAEAGVAPGTTLTLALPPPAYARRSGEIVAAELRAIGLNVRIQNIEWAQWLDQIFVNHAFDMTIVAHTEPMDIGIYGRDDYYFGYGAPAFKAIMEELNRTSDEAARRVLLGAAQRRIAEDDVNVFLFQLPKLGVWSKRVHGQWINSPIQASDLTAVWVSP